MSLDSLSSLKDGLESYAKVAWIFGSSLNGYEESNDIDLGIIVNDSTDTAKIDSILPTVSKRIGKKVDVTPIVYQDAIIRSKYNDYLLANLIFKKRYLFGDKEFLDNIQRDVFETEPTEESVKFNILEGIHVLDLSLLSFEEFKYYSRRLLKKSICNPTELLKVVVDNRFLNKYDFKKDDDFEDSQHYLTETLKNIPFSLGYLIAGKKIKKLNRTITLYDIEKKIDTLEDRLFNEVYGYYKYAKKHNYVDPLEVDKYLKVTLDIFQDSVA